jgi:hypothetical protein
MCCASVLVSEVRAATAVTRAPPVRSLRTLGLAWLPHDAAIVTFSAGASALVREAEKEMSQPPACWATFVKSIDAYHLVARRWGEPGVGYFIGRFERDRDESCLASAIRTSGADTQIGRDGNVTTFAFEGGKRVNLGCLTGQRVAMSPDRGRLREALSSARTLSPASPLARVLVRVPERGPWTATATDATSKLLGVPSIGFVYALDISPSDEVRPRSLDAKIVFASPGEAHRAMEAVRKLIADPSTPENLNRGLQALGARQRDDEVLLDAAVLFSGSPEGQALYDAAR